MNTPETAALLSLIRRHQPDVSGPVRVLTAGFNSVAVIAGHDLWRIPRQPQFERYLRSEAALMSEIGQLQAVAIPALQLFDNPVMTRHRLIPGEVLPPERYPDLSDRSRDELAETLAAGMVELHGLKVQIDPLEPWDDVEVIRTRLNLPDDLRPWAERVLADYAALGPDPEGEVFSHFDLHGWNMAFDFDAGRLNGIYDFGDAGRGPLHRDFVAPSLISTDFVIRLVARYERLSGRALDHRRIGLLCATHRLWELGDPELPEVVRPMLVNAAHEAARTWP
ncbi:phosphotransferase family protein [Pelagovum pacificum]|uniref:Aminoglycoside phosphotransferase family protein n=1 Tax=Pelagovum pacificum TaxID=2588711 RepID=A0A5C5GBN1_9RHOB|nr:aminoglycoside phosphotransferase family protein [Pelagovum pacificum]QQA42300.1 aminoglycoside phosphotransferase family protein [Pelagovum pacificum]TNY31384.1 aminoglycoside phosphotransferase family protein [Pelagovum pacificum]